LFSGQVTAYNGQSNSNSPPEAATASYFNCDGPSLSEIVYGGSVLAQPGEAGTPASRVSSSAYSEIMRRGDGMQFSCVFRIND
jgi:hypothetical protein